MGLQLIAAFSFTGSISFVWIAAKVLIGLGFVIFVHELGHFLVAKICGVKCEKFYVGFDVPIRIFGVSLPRTLGKFQWGETEYGIGIIPLGGYVKMLGQDDNPANAAREAERIKLARQAEQGDAGAVMDAEPFELDPRSFPAKSVPQRMAIISAGVIMNLIFAVIFAALAYRMGVTYDPCEIGGVTPGSPAWSADILPGSKIVQIGRKGHFSEHLRFDWDLQQRIAASGSSKPRQLPLLVDSSGTNEWVELQPSDRLVKLKLNPFVTIGIRSMTSNTLSELFPVMPEQSADKSDVPFQAGDRIVGANGQLFDTSQANQVGEIPSTELEQLLARRLSDPINFMVDRPVDSTSTGDAPQFNRLEITVAPTPMMMLGLEMKLGPIVALRNGSVAAAAGLKVGDVIQSVNGSPVGDPLTLGQRIDQFIGQSVALEVARGTEMVTVEVTPEDRFAYPQPAMMGSRTAIDSLGIAFEIQNQVASVAPGGPADQAGIHPGDKVTSVQFRVEGEKNQEIAEQLFRRLDKPIELTETLKNWTYVQDVIQEMLPGTKVIMTVDSGEKKQVVELVAQPSNEWYYADRGFRVTSLERIHTAASWGDAWSLGLRETKEKLFEVSSILIKLVTFQLSPTMLGGPLAIAAVAGSEASQGIPRLLLFLTLLSANLAILNFLPIPALDGGHMLFLSAEAVMGKPVDEKLQTTLTVIGVIFLLLLMVFVFSNDLTRFGKMLFS